MPGIIPPFSWDEINLAAGLNRPSVVKNFNNTTFWYWARALYQRAAYTIVFKDLPENWDNSIRDNLYWWLFIRGFVGIFNTKEYGLVFQPGDVVGFDFRVGKCRRKRLVRLVGSRSIVGVATRLCIHVKVRRPRLCETSFARANVDGRTDFTLVHQIVHIPIVPKHVRDHASIVRRLASIDARRPTKWTPVGIEPCVGIF